MPKVDLGDGLPPLDLPEGFTLERAREVISRTQGPDLSEEEKKARRREQQKASQARISAQRGHWRERGRKGTE